MTVAQLQRAALGPDLWNRRLRSGEAFVGADIQTQSTTQDDGIMRDPLGGRGGRGSGKTRVYFVPGGRYLFEQARGAISLWDLGFPVALRSDIDPVLPVPYLTLVDRVVDQRSRLGGELEVEFAVHPSADGQQLRLWIAITPSPSPSGEYKTRCVLLPLDRLMGKFED